ncbi:hypothetical protein BZA05DRAFT_74722 [Tricharina praecox]|uniref:uncharacterized protein n=1 Tax=Tricharina praecox TaxID=43433 RepID=UPI00221E39B5|nr:uncharacterized protein BZA05DRAFT_74722 [Tricharina praecox]KAI5849708.1 hypothetical protein BZA05DRAFT_74722 [Tricharina praecox]
MHSTRRHTTGLLLETVGSNVQRRFKAAAALPWMYTVAPYSRMEDWGCRMEKGESIPPIRRRRRRRRRRDGSWSANNSPLPATAGLRCSCIPSVLDEQAHLTGQSSSDRSVGRAHSFVAPPPSPNNSQERTQPGEEYYTVEYIPTLHSHTTVHTPTYVDVRPGRSRRRRWWWMWWMWRVIRRDVSELTHPHSGGENHLIVRRCREVYSPTTHPPSTHTHIHIHTHTHTASGAYTVPVLSLARSRGVVNGTGSRRAVCICSCSCRIWGAAYTTYVSMHGT